MRKTHQNGITIGREESAKTIASLRQRIAANQLTITHAADRLAQIDRLQSRRPHLKLPGVEIYFDTTPESEDYLMLRDYINLHLRRLECRSGPII